MHAGDQPGLHYVNTFVHASLMRVPTRSFRETVSLYVLILVYQHVISSTDPRAQAASTAAEVQTFEIFGVLAVFEVLHPLTLHKSSFYNTGTRIPVSVWPSNAAGIMQHEDP